MQQMYRFVPFPVTHKKRKLIARSIVFIPSKAILKNNNAIFRTGEGKMEKD